MLVLAAHVAIGAAARASPAFSRVYDTVTIGAALVIVLRARHVEWVAAVVGYVVAAEVLWRMTDGAIAWPATGKFALAGLLVIASFRFVPGWRRLIVPAVYLAMFVPGMVLAVSHFGLWESRGPISFNVMGPLSLAVSVVFFAQVRMTVATFRLVLWALVLPVVAIATNVLIGTITAGSIRFTGESNFATSGGFRPTYVSAVLGFGMVASVLLAVTEREHRLRLLEVGLALWFLGQALLTFARGGVLSAAVALFLALLVLAPRWLPALRRALPVVLVCAVACGAVVLLVNAYTDGKLVARYDEKIFARRDSIVREDLDLFREHPVVGVGIGVSQTERPRERHNDISHTEYSRLLAEQGLFGVVALILLLVIIVGAVWRAPPGIPRAFTAAFAGWAATQMLHSATRISLVGYAVGLAVAASGLRVGEPREIKG